MCVQYAPLHTENTELLKIDQPLPQGANKLKLKIET